jgi:6-phospho-beta-glucosidase
MKIAIIGGGGVRTPLLVNGLASSDLPIDQISLYDIDQERLSLIGGLAARFARDARVQICSLAADAVTGADFVFLSIRVGGMEARARDEAACVAAGVIGQETIGPAGFAMAVRTIPHAVAHARLVAEHAPHAWLINFTNPVGCVTQAMIAAGFARAIGICDTPTELFEDVAHALGVPSSACHFDYVGLNHLGWLREVLHEGRPLLAGRWEDEGFLRCVHRAPFFEPALLRALKLLPTEYVYYYYRAAEALTHTRRAGTTRGAEILRLNEDLFSSLRRSPADAKAVYERYLAARNAGYMQLESGAASPLPRAPWAALTGYDKIALQTVRAVHFRSNAVIPLNVRNASNVAELAPDDVIEVPAVVNGNGALPLQAGPLPGACRDLVIAVKAYERATVAASLSGDPGALHDALASNPLMAGRGDVRDIVARLQLTDTAALASHGGAAE